MLPVMSQTLLSVTHPTSNTSEPARCSHVETVARRLAVTSWCGSVGIDVLYVHGQGFFWQVVGGVQLAVLVIDTGQCCPTSEPSQKLLHTLRTRGNILRFVTRGKQLKIFRAGLARGARNRGNHQIYGQECATSS